MFDTDPFVAKAESESGSSVLAHCETRLTGDDALGKSGLLCVMEDGLVFVEEKVLDPGPVTIMRASEITEARMEEELFDEHLVVETDSGALTFTGVEAEVAERIIEAAGKPAPAAAVAPEQPAPAPAPAAVHAAPPAQAFGAPRAAPLPAAPMAQGPPPAPPPPPEAAQYQPPTKGVGKGCTMVFLVLLTTIGVVVNYLFADSDEPAKTSVTVLVTHKGVPVQDATIHVDERYACPISPCVVQTKPGLVRFKARSGMLQGGSTVTIGSDGPDQVTIEMTGLVLEVDDLLPKPKRVAPAPPTPAETASPEPSQQAQAGGGAPTSDEPEGEHGVVHINSIPPAQVFVDGRSMGRTPLTGVRLAPGRHMVVFRHPGRPVATRSVTVEAGKTQVVAIRLGERAP